MQVTASELLSKSSGMIARSWFIAVIYVVVGAGLQTLADQPGWERGGQFASSIAGLGLGYALVTKMVEREFDGGSLAGFWSYFGLSVLSGIGLALATIALIIPGIFLFVRWSAAYGFLCVEGEGVTQSLTSSYALTRSAFWPILISLLVPLAVGLCGIIPVAIWDSTAGTLPLWLSLPSNGAVSFAGVIITALGLSVYSLRRHREGQLDAVFA